MVKLRFSDELVEEAKQTATSRVTAEAEADAAFAALRTAEASQLEEGPGATRPERDAEGDDASHAREFQVRKQLLVLLRRAWSLENEITFTVMSPVRHQITIYDLSAPTVRSGHVTLASRN